MSTKDFIFFWDDSDGQNVEHIADNDVTMDEFEQVVVRGFADRQPSRSTPGRAPGYTPARWVVKDYTDRMEWLVVVFELDDLNDAWGIFPVTAFRPDALPTKG